MTERWLWILTVGADPGERVAEMAEEAAKEGPEVLARLAAAAEKALRSGLALRPDDLIALSPLERVALERAGQRLRVELAGLIGRAAQSHEAALAVSSPLDEGLEHDTAILAEAHAETVAEVRRGEAAWARPR